MDSVDNSSHREPPSHQGHQEVIKKYDHFLKSEIPSMVPSSCAGQPSPVVLAAIAYLTSVTTQNVIDQFVQVVPKEADGLGGLPLPVLQHHMSSYFPFGGALKIVWGQEFANDVIAEFIMLHPEIFPACDQQGDSVPWISFTQ